ncbi:unnamed protein product [Notodromas monacha]|uniref:SH2 domain-containing protein n=1 Tax=Notodromas monacha TaxID=399045 RepID=A0A7R9BU06_9CRUS|nr:unnamed protein product [Notodromas monacha]CAG0920715.1 unnamed protein product [Notodromas monacha]
MAKPPSRRDSREDQDCCWYHGRISRDVAEDRLKFGEEKPQDGRFLVRDFCTVGDVSDKCDYVLSMTFGGEVQHYIIQQLCDDAFYSIDGGPVVHGLDALIEQYQLRRGGLPCCLQFRLPGMPPPAETRRHGRTNLLHRSTKEGNLEIIREVIQSGYHNLDAKNQDGQTVLHIAVNHGHLEALELLLSSGASPNIVDTKGFSPLHYACRRSENEMVVRLLNQGADPRLRSTYENLVPLHEAAQANNIECCKALLSRGCPKRPRNKDDELPEELAEKAGHSECAEIIRHSKIIWQSDFPPRDKWLHNDLTSREETREIFIEECSTPDSCELRVTRNRHSKLPISMIFNDEVGPGDVIPATPFYYLMNGCRKLMKRRERGSHLAKCPASVVTCTAEWNRWPMWYHLSMHGHSNQGHTNTYLPFYCFGLSSISHHLGELIMRPPGDVLLLFVLSFKRRFYAEYLSGMLNFKAAKISDSRH